MVLLVAPSWMNFVILLCLIAETILAQRNISSMPSSSTIATDYTNFIVRAQFPVSDVSATCVWKYPGRTTSSFIVVVSGITCNPVNNPPVELVSCVNNGTTIASNLTILQPLSAGSLDVSVACDGRTILTLPTIIVQDCSLNITNSTEVITSSGSTSFTFNNSYALSCALVSTGPPVNSTCQADASFSPLPNCTLGGSGSGSIITGGDIAVIVIFIVVPSGGTVASVVLSEQDKISGNIAAFITGLCTIAEVILIITYSALHNSKCSFSGSCLTSGEAAGIAVACTLVVLALGATALFKIKKIVCFRSAKN